jgi:hypothetical protein
MERTLEVMEEELKRVKEERKPLYEAVNALDKEIAKLKDEIVAFKLNNGLYHPMSELIDYLGKRISSITLVERDKEGALDTEFMYCDEIFEVDEYAHLYYSSWSGGVMRYDNNTKMYVHSYYGCPTYHDYVGFLEIEIDEDW